MKILALEFSSPQRSTAIVCADANNGSFIALEVLETGARGTNTLDMIEKVLLDAKLEREQIGCLAVGLGPGSYTGIRTAIALAQGWQLAREVKLLGVSSAECIAAQARAENFVGTASVVIDAQRNEFYVARYEINPGACREIEPLRLASLADIQERERAEEALIGPEVTRWFPSGKIIFPRAATLGRLAMGRNDFMPGEKLEPIYLRETAFVKAPAPRIISS
jgi:tRNA threonylcarbamoyl adenosine modification protein YeaZ